MRLNRSQRIRLSAGPGGRRRGAFTLIELILVMALLVIIISLVSPQLSSFFRGRALDNEARRLMTLTRYGQSRAVAEGIPMVLWLDADAGRYGLQAQPGYLETDAHAVEYDLEDRLKLEVGDPLNMAAGYRVASDYGNVLLPPMLVTLPELSANVRNIVFNPDGFVAPTSPGRLFLRDGESDPNPVVLLPARDRRSYVISTNQNHALQP